MNYVNVMLTRPDDGEQYNEVFVEAKGWYVWDPVRHAYVCIWDGELLEWGEDVYKITAWTRSGHGPWSKYTP